jgi:hypothetical protein
VHAAQLGFGVQRWLDPKWTVSLDLSLASWGSYSHVETDTEDDRSEDSQGTAWSLDPRTNRMVHLFW